MSSPLNEVIQGTMISELPPCISSVENKVCLYTPLVHSVSTPLHPYLIENTSLHRVFFLSDATDELITFIQKIYEMMEYNYHVVPLSFAESFTPLQWMDFYQHFSTQYGKSFPTQYSKSFPLHPLLEDAIQEYATTYLQQLHAKSTLYQLIGSSTSRIDPSEAKKAKEAKGEAKEEKKENTTDKIPSIDSPIIGIETKNTFYLPTKPMENPVDFDSFYTPYYHLDQDWEKSRKEAHYKIVILMDKEQATTMVFHGDDCQQVSALIKQMDGYLLLGEYSHLGEPVKDKLASFFHLRPFVDEQDARRKVESYEILLDIAPKKNGENSTLEDKIKDYLLANYEITGNGKKIMKACIL